MLLFCAAYFGCRTGVARGSKLEPRLGSLVGHLILILIGAMYLLVIFHARHWQDVTMNDTRPEIGPYP